MTRANPFAEHELRAPRLTLAEAGAERMLALGVVVQSTGPHANVLKLKPPLCGTATDVDFLAAALTTGW